MKVNGIDIARYSARQWTVNVEITALKNDSEKTPGSLNPLLLPAELELKKIKITVMVNGKNREEIRRSVSNLIAAMLKPVEIELDGFSNRFYAVLTNAEEAEISLQRFHKATLEFVGYEYGQEVTVDFTQQQITVNNPGNIETPVIIELTPLIGKQEVTINGIVRDPNTGADKPVIVRRLTQNQKIVIDAESGLITENGKNKFEDVELWDLPSLLPGTNRIKLNQSGINTTVRFKPRFI